MKKPRKGNGHGGRRPGAGGLPKAERIRRLRATSDALATVAPKKSKELAAQAELDEIASSSAELVKKRRHLHKKHAVWIEKFAETGFEDPERAAREAGFRRPGAGFKLAIRLRDLIDIERLKRKLRAEMPVEEALQELAVIARQNDDLRVKLGGVQTVLRVHGWLSDKLPAEDRQQRVREVAAIIDTIKQRTSISKGTAVKVRAMIETAETTTTRTERTRETVTAEVELGEDGEGGESGDGA